MVEARKKPGGSWGCLWLVLGAFALLIGLAILSFSSAISGEEFSPNTFQTRSFNYARMPWWGVRMSPTKLGATFPAAAIDVLKHLPTSTQVPQWHVVSISGIRRETHGAKTLVDAFKQRTPEGSDMWGAWSANHPKAAAVFWPLVQQIAFQQLYESIPEILQVAETTTDPVSLEKESLSVLLRVVQDRIQRSTEDAQTQELLDWMTNLPVNDPSVAQWFDQQREVMRKKATP